MLLLGEDKIWRRTIGSPVAGPNHMGRAGRIVSVLSMPRLVLKV